MRTDSVNLSNDAQQAAAKEITKSFGEAYSHPRKYKGKSKGAQEAHEAIRPTRMSRHRLREIMTKHDCIDLIWKRTLASQMSDAQLERTNVKIAIASSQAVKEQFTANGEMIKFDGFLKVYLEGIDNDEQEQEGMLPKLVKADVLGCKLYYCHRAFYKTAVPFY